jgi:hypothetical protein
MVNTGSEGLVEWSIVEVDVVEEVNLRLAIIVGMTNLFTVCRGGGTGSEGVGR